MDDVIKSAREIALEKASRIGNATDEERLSWKYQPLGEAIASKYLGNDANMLTEISKYPAEAKKYLENGITDTLMRNIAMPKTDSAKKAAKKAMEGLALIRNNKTALENVFSKIRYLYNHYENEGKKQREQAYQNLKIEVEARIQQSIQQQMGGSHSNAKIDVERQPQFQQEWRKMQDQMDAAYMLHLNDYKQELAAIE